jgi:hypothetical protein
MTKNSVDLLSGIYKVTPNKVYIIHHGLPACTARFRSRKVTLAWLFAVALAYDVRGYSWIDL